VNARSIHREEIARVTEALSIPHNQVNSSCQQLPCWKWIDSTSSAAHQA